VAGALELLEDHLVHLGAGLHQRRGEDRQRAAVLDVAGGTEEPLRRVQRRGVHAAGEDASRGRGRAGVGTAQAGERVPQHGGVAQPSGTAPSRPLPAGRWARSMASCATIVWSEAGRSKVEAMTSPLTVRCMSVTSSGRSSTSTTMRWTSGLFVVIEFAICCMM